MKCLPECGFDQKPENLAILTRHVESCGVAVPSSEMKVVWSNSEFSVSREVGEDETEIEVTFRDFEDAPTVPALVVPQAAGLFSDSVIGDATNVVVIPSETL